jgi:RNA polymerase sigma factor (sigma-70 family)
VSYTSAIEDLCSQSWFEIYNQLKKNFQFNTTEQLKFYLYQIARSETCKFMRNRISIRKQLGTDENLQFPRFDAEYEKNNNAFISVEYTEDDHLIEKVLPALVNKLSEKEYKVLTMHLSGATQKEIATELGVGVKTIYNIRKKYPIKQSVSLNKT